MNKVVLVGRLTAAPELKTSQSGKSFTRFTVAVGRRFKKEGQPDTDFINCATFGKTAETICKYLDKGSMIAVEGSIQTGSYEKDGVKRYTTDVMVDSFTFCGSAKKESDGLDDEDFSLIADDDDVPF